MKTLQEIIDEHKNLSVEEMKINSCTLLQIFNHLKNNLEEADNDPSYRKRERMRTKLALRKIGGWKDYFEKEIK